MGTMTSQINSLTIVYSAVYSCADQRKHQSSMSLAFVQGIHRWPVNFPHKGPVNRTLSCICTIPSTKIITPCFTEGNTDQKPINSLAPWKFEWIFRHVIFKQILVIDGWGIPCKIALIWMLLDFADDQSTLVQVTALCRQVTSRYQSQCWPRSMSPTGVTRPQWVKYDLKLGHIDR